MLLNSVARGQEFVFDTQGQDAPVQWILSLLEARSSPEALFGKLAGAFPCSTLRQPDLLAEAITE